MQQLTNNEIARIFAMYLGCAMISPFRPYYRPDLNTPDYVSGIRRNEYNVPYVQNSSGKYYRLDNGKCKIVLSSLSAITEEHSIQIGELLGYGQTPTRPSFVARVKGKSFIEYWSDNFGNANPIITTTIFQYLIQQGYAVPLFISLNHPLNNKTAIELGIAIDATTIQ